MGLVGQPHAPAASTPGKDPVPIVQEAEWAPGSVWTGGKSRPHWDSIPDRPARSQSLYRLNYQVHRTEGRNENMLTVFLTVVLCSLAETVVSDEPAKSIFMLEE